jgi:hypothetical protein
VALLLVAVAQVKLRVTVVLDSVDEVLVTVDLVAVSVGIVLASVTCSGRRLCCSSRSSGDSLQVSTLTWFVFESFHYQIHVL